MNWLQGIVNWLGGKTDNPVPNKSFDWASFLRKKAVKESAPTASGNQPSGTATRTTTETPTSAPANPNDVTLGNLVDKYFPNLLKPNP